MANRKKEIMFLFLFALFLRLLFFVIINFFSITNMDFTPDHDFYPYDDAARAIIKDGFFTDNIFLLRKILLYPLFISLFYRMLGTDPIPVQFIQLFQIIISGFSIIFIYFITESLFKNRNIAFTAGILLSIYPHHIFLSLYLLSDNNYVTLLIISIYLIIKFINTQSYKIAILTGIIFGLTILQRPIITLFLLLAIIYIYINSEYRFRKIVLSRILIIFIFFIIIWIPWPIRNKIMYNEYFSLGTGGGTALYQGNSENSTGGYGGDVISGIDYTDPFDNISGNESYINNLYKTEAIKAIKKDPIKFIKRIPVRWWNMIRPNYANASFINNLITIPIYLFVVIFSIIGMIYSRKHKYVNLLYIYIIYHFIIHGIYIANIRYRISFEPILIIFAAYGLIKIANKLIKLYEKNKSTNNS